MKEKLISHSNAKDFSNLNWAVVVGNGRDAAEHPNCWNKAFLGERDSLSTSR